jgi:hypothetical protein
MNFDPDARLTVEKRVWRSQNFVFWRILFEVPKKNFTDVLAK